MRFTAHTKKSCQESLILGCCSVIHESPTLLKLLDSFMRMLGVDPTKLFITMIHEIIGDDVRDSWM